MLWVLKNLWSKYAKIPLAAKAAGWFVVCSLLQKSVSFLTTPIFTRLMPREEYGLFSTYISVYSIVVVFCSLVMEKCIYPNRIAKASSEEEKNAAAIPLLSLSFVATCIVFGLYWVAHPFFDRLVGLPTSLMCLMFLHALCEPAIAFYSVRQRFAFKYISLLLLTLGLVLGNTVLGIWFVSHAQHNQAGARVLSVVITQIAIATGLYFHFWAKGHGVFSTKGWGHALGVQLPLLPHGLSLIVLASSDRIMINSIVGPAQAAMYTVAYSAGYIVGTLKTSIVSALGPWIYHKIKIRDWTAIENVAKCLLLLMMSLTFVFISFAPEILGVLAPPSYAEAVYVLPPVAASSFFTFLYSMFSTVSFYFEKTKTIMAASLVGSVSNILLNAVCIPVFGYIAAGYTTLACYIFFCIAHFAIMRKICTRELGGVRIFNGRQALLVSCLVIAISMFYAFSYSIPFVRYASLFVTLVFLFLKRKLFLESLRTIRTKHQ